MKRINKKGQVSRSVILFSLLIFYVFLGVMYGLYGSTVDKYAITRYDNTVVNNQNLELGTDYSMSTDTSTWMSNSQDKSGINSLLGYVVTGFKEVPIVLNIILFLPLAIFTGYLIIASFVPTVNAGG